MADGLDGDTIIGAPFAPLRSVARSAEDSGAGLLEGDSPRLFKIRGADSHGQRSSANILIKRRYAWRGYQTGALPEKQTGDRLTLSATSGDAAIGTLTIGFDGAQGIFVEEAYGPEVAALRAAGRKICEFTKLAVEKIDESRQVLASLFHVAYIIAHRIRGYDTLLIEVNPRHVGYYRRMLGCRVLAGERLNTRVNAPAMLLSLDFTYTLEQIGRFGGQPELAARERSLYPYAFSMKEEAGIINRVLQATWAANN